LCVILWTVVAIVGAWYVGSVSNETMDTTPEYIIDVGFGDNESEDEDEDNLSIDMKSKQGSGPADGPRSPGSAVDFGDEEFTAQELHISVNPVSELHREEIVLKPSPRSPQSPSAAQSRKEMLSEVKAGLFDDHSVNHAARSRVDALFLEGAAAGQRSRSGSTHVSSHKQSPSRRKGSPKNVPKSARSIESRERSATVTDSEVNQSESTIARIKRTRQKRLDLVRKEQQSTASEVEMAEAPSESSARLSQWLHSETDISKKDRSKANNKTSESQDGRSSQQDRPQEAAYVASPRRAAHDESKHMPLSPKRSKKVKNLRDVSPKEPSLINI